MPWRRPSERTELVHIVVTGHHKRTYPRKYYVFVIDVTWNNSERFEIYRRYSEFFSFQTTLKALFPDAAGRRNVERTIPQLPKRIFVGRSHVAKVAEARVEQINRYCQTLVSLDPKISESSHVIGFFSPRIGDKTLPKLQLHRPASLHPMKIPAGSLFEEYCALAEYQAEDPSQVSFTSGQIVLVLNKDTSGWWMCQVNDKVGWGPPSYLKKVDKGESTEEGESDSDDDFLGLPGYVDSEKEGGTDSGFASNPETTKEAISEGGKGFNVPEIEFQEYKAIDSYEAQGDGQVSFEEGDIIQVLDKIEDGWWFVAKGQEEGWVPCSYLEPLKVGQDEDDTISSLDVEKYITIEEYTAEEDDELSFPKGVTVDVLQKSLDGWWLIKHDRKAALAPATFLMRKESSEHSPLIARKSSLATLTEAPEEGVEDKPQEEKVNTLTRASYRQPPRKQSVRRRVTKRKKKQQAAIDGLKAPPTIREESPSPTPPVQVRKLSEPNIVASISPNKHIGAARKLSEGSILPQQQLLDTSELPAQRKIPLDAALSGAPKIAANGALVHQLDKATLTSSGAIDSDVEEHEYSNIDPQKYLKEKRQKKLRELQQRMDGESPTTSDSEVERETSSSWTGRSSLGGSSQRELQGSGGKSQELIRRWERRLSSDSEDSISSPTRRPVATPRAKKPELKPKPKVFHVPPRPRMSQIDRARGKVNTGAAAVAQKEEVSAQAEQKPHMPLRPRGTEIRRARQQVKPSNSSPLSQPPTPSSLTPTITATNDKGDQHVVLPSSKNSAFKPISNRRSPSPGLAIVKEERAEDAGTTPSALGLKAGNHRPRSPRGKSPSRTPSPSVSVVAVSLAPPKSSRKERSHSESDAQDTTPSPSSSSPASSPMTTADKEIGGNPLNQQMAETLLKYVLASQDNSLKNALRECIMSNPEAVKALQK